MKKNVIVAAVLLVLALLAGLFAMNWVVQKSLLSREERAWIENALSHNASLSQRFGTTYSLHAVDAGSEVFLNPDGSGHGTYPFLIKSEHGTSHLKVQWRRQPGSDELSIEVYETTSERSPELLFSEVIGAARQARKQIPQISTINGWPRFLPHVLSPGLAFG